jgi:hypothetical protein
MSIIVVCPGCLKSFNVSDKFAGKSGKCPNCKRTLHVPTKETEVKVHAPEAFSSGGKSVSGKLITKPIARVNAKIKPVKAAILLATVAGVLIVTYVLGQAALFDSIIVTAIGLLLVSPPLTVAAYEALRDDEFEPYRGKMLVIRSAGCGLAYAALWGFFAVLSPNIVTGEVWNWFFILPFVAMGAMVPMAAFDLEFGDGAIHCGFYLLATLILRWAAGMPPIWSMPH